MARVEIIIDGRCFKSIAEAARYHGVLPSTAYSRIRRGWNVVEAVTTPNISVVSTLLILLR